MLKRLIILFTLGFVALIWYNYSNETTLPVYQLVQEPIELTSGQAGYSLTVDISFGDDDVEKWIATMKQPYPLLFLDLAWMKRFPEMVELLVQKKIPVGLLGNTSDYYDDHDTSFPKEVKEFEALTGEAPLYFRTRDGIFSSRVLELCFKAKVNAISASKRWNEEFVKLEEGDILQVPLHQHERISWSELKKIQASYSFQSVEETILGMNIETKTYP